MKVQFDEEGSLFSKIMLQALFTLLSMGLYLPWAVTNMRRLVWSRISLNGYRLTYLGKSSELVKGYLLLLLIYIVAQIPGGLIPTEGDINLVVQILAFIFGVSFSFGLFYKIQLGSFKYQVNRALYQGVRLATDLPSLKDQYLLFLKWGFLTTLSLGLAFPYFYFRVDVLKFNSLRYGQESFTFSLSFKNYLSIFINAFLRFIIAVTLIAGCWTILNVIADIFSLPLLKLVITFVFVFGFIFTSVIILLKIGYDLFLLKISAIKSSNLSFSTDLKFTTYLKNHSINVLIFVCTFGLAVPVILILNIKMFARSLSVNGIETLINIAPKSTQDLLSLNVSLVEVAEHNVDLSIMDVL